MIKAGFLEELVDDCEKDRIKTKTDIEYCAGCPLGNLCGEIIKLNKIHKVSN